MSHENARADVGIYHVEHVALFFFGEDIGFFLAGFAERRAGAAAFRILRPSAPVLNMTLPVFGFTIVCRPMCQLKRKPGDKTKTLWPTVMPNRKKTLGETCEELRGHLHESRTREKRAREEIVVATKILRQKEEDILQ